MADIVHQLEHEEDAYPARPQVFQGYTYLRRRSVFRVKSGCAIL